MAPLVCCCVTLLMLLLFSLEVYYIFLSSLRGSILPSVSLSQEGSRDCSSMHVCILVKMHIEGEELSD